LFFLFLPAICRAASTALAPDNLAESFPALRGLRENDFFRNVLAGLLTGVLWTLFFSICPYIFKSIANFGSGATSVREAEFIATKYYWVFLLTTAFTGTSLSNILLNSLNSGAFPTENMSIEASARTASSNTKHIPLLFYQALTLDKTLKRVSMALCCYRVLF
jgi:hypothetical protein